MPMYQKVCKWTKNVDVFAQDFLLIPIHDAAHWSLAIICHPGVLLKRFLALRDCALSVFHLCYAHIAAVSCTMPPYDHAD